MGHGFKVGDTAIIVSSLAGNEGMIVRIVADTFDGIFHGVEWDNPTADLIAGSLGSELKYFSDMGDELGVMEFTHPDLPLTSANLRRLQAISE